MFTSLCSIILFSIALLGMSGLPESIGATLFVSVDHFIVSILAASFFVSQILLSTSVKVRHWMVRFLTLLTGLCTVLMLCRLTLNPSQMPDQSLLLLVRVLIGGMFAGMLLGPVSYLVKRWGWMPTQERKHIATSGDTLLRWSVCLLAAFLIPYTHASFLKSYHSEQMEAAIQKNRVDKARVNARDLVRLNPQSEWQSRPITAVWKDLEREAALLRVQLAQMENGTRASSSGSQIQILIRLDELDEATQLLLPLLDSPSLGAVAWDTYGLILQRQENWSESLAAYRKSLTRWQESDNDAQAMAGIVSAYKGIALAEKKTGHKAAAEKTYQKLLELAPTAENHFLLARFYEENQQTTLANTHAKRAAELAPATFAEPAQKLIGMMQSAHLGCFQVYRNQR